MTTLPSAKPKLKHKSARIPMVAMESRIAPMGLNTSMFEGARGADHKTDPGALADQATQSTNPSVFKEFLKAFQGNKEEKK